MGKLLCRTGQDLFWPSELPSILCGTDSTLYWKHLAGGFCSILTQQLVCSGFVNHTCKDANVPAAPTPHPWRSSIRCRAGGYWGHLSHRELITLFKMTGALCHGVMCCCRCLHPQLNKLFVDAAMRSCMQAVYKCEIHSLYPKITTSFFLEGCLLPLNYVEPVGKK